MLSEKDSEAGVIDLPSPLSELRQQSSEEMARFDSPEPTATERPILRQRGTHLKVGVGAKQVISSGQGSENIVPGESDGPVFEHGTLSPPS